MLKFILLTQFASTLFMVGLIWFVQIVHYPLFAGVGADQFSQYEQQHQQLTTYVVMPVMLLELATAIALIPYSPSLSMARNLVSKSETPRMTG